MLRILLSHWSRHDIRWYHLKDSWLMFAFVKKQSLIASCIPSNCTKSNDIKTEMSRYVKGLWIRNSCGRHFFTFPSRAGMFCNVISHLCFILYGSELSDCFTLCCCTKDYFERSALMLIQLHSNEFVAYKY